MAIKGLVASLVIGAGVLSAAGAAAAGDTESCKKVRLSDVGWTDITATTAMTAAMLQAMGYDSTIQQLSVPVTYASLKNKDIDVFLGNWMPSMTGDVKPFLDDKSVRLIGKIKSVESGIAYLTYEGQIAGSHNTQSNKGLCHGEAKLIGVGRYDTKAKRMLALTLVFDGVFRGVRPYDQCARRHRTLRSDE